VTRRRGLTLTTIATAVALVSPPAAAEKLFRMLTAKEIGAKIIGRDLTDVSFLQVRNRWRLRDPNA
jgi:hypothetical protein